MQDLSTCPHCQCYVKAHETVCPFCEGELGTAAQRASIALPRGISRASAFALRAALVAGVASVAACGGEAEESAHGSPQKTGGATASGGTDTGGADAASGGSDSSSTGGQLASGGIQLNDPGTGGDDMGQGGYTPIPIYGGVFPDPDLRAKV